MTELESMSTCADTSDNKSLSRMHEKDVAKLILENAQHLEGEDALAVAMARQTLGITEETVGKSGVPADLWCQG